MLTDLRGRRKGDEKSSFVSSIFMYSNINLIVTWRGEKKEKEKIDENF